ncbi:MAG: hypothetical protein CBC65_000430 [Rhodothermaceae bacterium TMED105]|jgi:hypothetical protein|nr:MAG: hypothetical protein CBC65_000430 [Rhodothermaceae bacterium TMED105]|tara:strand:+ start:2867 stop:3340 length:474 start_codon:yes stop_codon:yes gene_type:complete
MGTPLFQSEGVNVEIRKTEYWDDVDVMWLGISTSPNLASIQKLSTVFEMWLKNSERMFILWPEDVQESEQLAPPDLPSLIHIVSRLLEHRELIKERLVCTCIQTKGLDGLLKMVKETFLSMYTPIAPFDLVVGPNEADHFVKKCIKKRKKICTVTSV